jgi:hypothetical protein
MAKIIKITFYTTLILTTVSITYNYADCSGQVWLAIAFTLACCGKILDTYRR